MRTLSFALLLVAFVTAHADDILANEDFSNGAANWKGDAREPDVSAPNSIPSLDSTSTPANNGLVVQLKPDTCTTISQIFSTHETSLTLTATYKISSDYKAAGWGPDGLKSFITGLLNLRIEGAIEAAPGSWLTLIADPMQAKICYCSFTPATGNPAAQTTAATFPQLMAHAEKTFCLVFPPGQGTITLQKISLNPAGPSGTPAGLQP